MQYASMPNLLVRDLPAHVHETLVRRARAGGQSLQAYVTAELTRIATTPTVEEIVAQIDRRKGGRVGFRQAVSDLDAARSEE